MGSDSLIKGNSRIGGFFIYHYDRAGSFRVKGIFYKKNSLVKSHILGYDGVWYRSFWSERSGNHLN